MTLRTFNLPDVGEGLTEAEIVQWKVAPGAAVTVNEIICEIETAKSLVELSSPYEGTVAGLLVPEGETVEVGTPIISVEDGVGAPTEEWVVDEEERARVAANDDGRSAARARTDAAPGPLVGSGPKADAATRRPRKGRPLPSQSVHGRPESPASQAVPGAEGRVGPHGQRSGRVLAKPPVRKAARDLGIDLADVPATGAAGEVTKQDLLGHRSRRDAEQGGADPLGSGPAPLGGGRVERIPVKGVRRATARAMVQSAFTAPHVSIFVDVDASRTMEFVKRLKAGRDFEGVRVSPLLILARAVIWAAARNPSVNATWSEDEILVKHFVNLGIAAATPRGLMVPNIRDAQDLSLRELALALDELVATARAGRTQPARMQGGSLTITNIGALGVDAGTPIINPGEVAIVALGTIRQKPWVVDGEVVPRWITTLGGSFDHRVVDGDLGARFLTDVASILEEPALLLD